MVPPNRVPIRCLPVAPGSHLVSAASTVRRRTAFPRLAPSHSGSTPPCNDFASSDFPKTVIALGGYLRRGRTGYVTWLWYRRLYLVAYRHRWPREVANHVAAVTLSLNSWASTARRQPSWSLVQPKRQLCADGADFMSAQPGRMALYAVSCNRPATSPPAASQNCAATPRAAVNAERHHVFLSPAVRDLCRHATRARPVPAKSRTADARRAKLGVDVGLPHIRPRFGYGTMRRRRAQRRAGGRPAKMRMLSPKLSVAVEPGMDPTHVELHGVPRP